MYSEKDILYNIALSFISGVRDIGVKRLISTFGTAEAVFKAKKKDFVRAPGIGETTAVKLVNSFTSALTRAEEELLYVYSNELGVVSWFDDDYPSRLKECDDAPIVLYYKGKPDFNAKKIVSIVGTRKATKYGLNFCEDIIEKLAEKYSDIVIVSGLAYGIDVAAHKAALSHNLYTWGVLGHSLESIYPSIHKPIAEEMIKNNGALISDFPHGSPTEPSNFLKRNRIVAGLCDALIIIESGKKGGAMVTANIANHYNKDVFAVPGNLNSVYSAGCNMLIKTNRAHLLESIDDIDYILNWRSDVEIQGKKSMKSYQDLSEQELKIVAILDKYDFLDIDNIVRQAGLDANSLSLILLELEFKGVVRALPGKLFALKGK